MSPSRQSTINRALVVTIGCAAVAFSILLAASAQRRNLPKPVVKVAPKHPPENAIIPRRELFFRLDRQRRNKNVDPNLEGPLLREPPQILWKVVTRDGVSTYQPLVPPPPKIIQVHAVNLAVFGGELEAVTTAMAAAEAGLKVALVTDCSLGGISSDTGANLRYLDGTHTITRTRSQLELYQTIGVLGNVAIPAGVDQKIEHHLKQYFSGRITLIRTNSLNKMRVAKSDHVQFVDLPEGVRVRARSFLDMDPECRLGELSGLPLSIETPNLSHGLVFDLQNMRPGDYEALDRKDKITSVALLRLTAAVPQRALMEPGFKESLDRLETLLRTDKTRIFEHSSFGYSALAQGYDFFMRCRSSVRPNPRYAWLNARRLMSGFNVSHLGTTANLNSISYSLNETVLQHAHSLHRNGRWKPIVETEVQGLQDYFRYVTGNPKLVVRIPDQFYVRRSTAYFETKLPFTLADFQRPVLGKWWMQYPMDFRDLRIRDEFDRDFAREVYSFARGVRKWECRPSSCSTTIPNLYLLNKCAVTPRYSGGLRIVQNLINTGQAWVEANTGNRTELALRPKNARNNSSSL